MNPNRLFTRSLTPLWAAAMLTQNSSAHAQSWQTALDYQYAAGQAAAGWFGTAADSLGNVFVAGEAIDGSDIDHGFVLATDTRGARWVISDNPLSSPPSTPLK